MVRVVVVHGIGQEWRGWETLAGPVRAALCDGVRMAVDPSAPSPLGAGDVGVAFFGDLFTAPGSRPGGLPPWDEYDVEAGVEQELLGCVVGGCS